MNPAIGAPATYPVHAACPRCGDMLTIPVHLGTVLQESSDDDPQLKVKLSAKPVVHLVQGTLDTGAGGPHE